MTATWASSHKPQPAGTKFVVPEIDAPNVAGVRAFGIGDDVAALRAAVESGRVTALYVYDPGPATLGDVLYAGKSTKPIPEKDWVALVRSIAAGDQLALHALYERAHRLVYTLIVRLTKNRETAEELTLDVFHDVWRRASRYDAANGTVLGWIMNQARSRAIDRLRASFEARTVSIIRIGAS